MPHIARNLNIGKQTRLRKGVKDVRLNDQPVGLPPGAIRCVPLQHRVAAHGVQLRAIAVQRDGEPAEEEGGKQAQQQHRA